MGNSSPFSAADSELENAFRRRAADLHAITRRAGEEESADLAQEAYAKCIHAARASELRKPVHFLFKIARNTVIDTLRSKARSTAIFRDVSVDNAPTSLPGPERVLLAKERLRLALEIIDSMPPKRREVFLLHRIDDLSYAQIARQQGISIKTVEKHMALAMVQLSGEIDEYGSA